VTDSMRNDVPDALWADLLAAYGIVDNPNDVQAVTFHADGSITLVTIDDVEA
jgi:hypothetical protein